MKESYTGVVTAIKLSHNPKNNVYTLLSDKIVNIKCELLLELYDDVVINPSAFKEDIVDSASIQIKGKVKTKEYDALISKIVKKHTKAMKRVDIKISELDKISKKMNKDLTKSISSFLRCLLSGAPIVIRYHNDCDGSSGAVGLYRALGSLQSSLGWNTQNLSWHMNKSVAYSKDALTNDTFFFNSFSSIEHPMVFITDFGTSEESEAAISMAESKFDFVWLDHHPIYEGFPEKKIGHYINPWNFGGNSDYTAGFLCCEFAEMLSGLKLSELKLASLIGDYSVYAKREDKTAQKISVVLDFLTGRKDPDTLTPGYIESVISDKEKLAETFGYASNLMSEALEIGIKKMRRYSGKNNIQIYVLDFKHISNSSEYPLPGRYSSILHGHIESTHGPRTLTIVHYGSYISVRVSRAIAEEVNILDIMNDIKQSSEYVYGGGGHKSAGSIRTDKEHIDEVKEDLLKRLGVHPT